MKAEGQEADDRNLWSEIQTLELLSQVIEQWGQDTRHGPENGAEVSVTETTETNL